MTNLQTTNPRTNMRPLEAARLTMPEGQRAAFDVSDQGLAELYATVCAGRVGWIAETGEWTAWDGCKWSTAQANAISKLAFDDLIRKALAAGADPGATHIQRDVYIDQARRLSSARARANTLSLAEPKLAVSVADFDHDARDLLNTPSGIVNLRTGDVTPCDPKRRLTLCTAVPYDPDAPFPKRFAEVVNALAAGDPETEDYLWRAIGYTLTGHVHEDAAFYLRGPGGNGKSTLLKSLRAVLGDYAHSLEIRHLTAGNDSMHSTEFAALRGRRLVVLSEVDRGQRLSLSRFKDLTGGEIAAPREIRQRATDAAVFEPTAKLWMFGNYDLAIGGNDEGTWRRMHRIESERTFAHSGVREALVAQEGEGILAVAIAAAGEWYKRGLGAPARVRASTAAYRTSQDLVGKFFSDCLVFEAGAVLPKSQFTHAYDEWCTDEGVERKTGPKDMASRMAERGVTEGYSGSGHAAKRVRVWRGVRLATAGDHSSSGNGEPGEPANTP